VEIKIDNIKIVYNETGKDSKTNIILLHGWGANKESFLPVQGYFSNKFKVYNIDMPGFGESEKPPITYTVSDYAKIILEFIKMLELDNVVLVGHSFGGRVIMKLVGELNYKPQKIIFVDSAGVKPKRKFSYYYKVYSYKLFRKIVTLTMGKKKSEKIINYWRNKVGSEDYKNADNTMREVFKNVVSEDLVPYISNIKVPTLIVWGENDQDTPLKDARKIESLIEDSGVVVLKNAGHFSYLDNLNEFLIITSKFLEECE